MKRRIICILLALAMIFAMLGMAQTVYALDNLKNVKISSSGMLTWDSFPGAKIYLFSSESAAEWVETRSVDLNKWFTDISAPSGVHSIYLAAYSDYSSDGGKQLSAEWTGSYSHTASLPQLGTPINLK